VKTEKAGNFIHHITRQQFSGVIPQDSLSNRAGKTALNSYQLLNTPQQYQGLKKKYQTLVTQTTTHILRRIESHFRI
jgi:hypothetical protein